MQTRILNECSRYVIGLILAISQYPAVCKAFNSDSLNQLIADKKITGVDQLLHYLPYPLLSRYTLVFKSRSLQGASYQDPRVILFGPNAKFILTFNGNPDQAGFNSVEVMDFDEQRDQFVFREYVFPDSASQNQSVFISVPNPAKCLLCHGNPARPVWDTHPTWPGVYGERYRTALSEAEQAGLKRFLAHQRMHSRYRHLKNIHVFTDPITFAPSAQSTYNGTEKESPNATLSHYLSLLNGRALVQELTQSPAFEQYKYALLGSFSPECGSIASFLPREQRADWMANFDQFSSLTQRANQEQDQRKRLRSLTPDNVTGFAQGDMETLTPLRYLSEHGLRVSTEGWTTALEKNSYDYTAPQPLASMMEVRLFNIMANTEPSLHEFAPQRHLGMNPRYCKYLRQKSQDNFKN